MSMIYEGLRVLDLGWGIGGSMIGMLMADQGASVTKIEPPGGEPFAQTTGYKVWNRGKRSAFLDLKEQADRDRFLALVRDADVLIETMRPGAMQRLGLAYEELRAVNSRLIHCSITAYGHDAAESDRAGYEALVAARSGSQYAQRGGILSAGDIGYPDVEIPEGAEQGARKEGPIFSASSWLGLGAGYRAALGVAAALLTRERTGLGQFVHTAMALPPAEAATRESSIGDAPLAGGWMAFKGAPKGLFECKDGRWVHQWALRPLTIIAAAEYDSLDDAPSPDSDSSRHDPDRIGMEPEVIYEVLHYYPLMAAAFRKFPAADWGRYGLRTRVAVYEVRTPEEALSDPLLAKDGVVVEVEDAEWGPIRHVGVIEEYSETPGVIGGRAPVPGEHSGEIRAEADAALAARPLGVLAKQVPGEHLAQPLQGLRILDLGLALAGPFGAAQLAALGAEVIKVNAPWDGWWMQTGLARMGEAGKRGIGLNLQTERGREVLSRLVRKSDAIMHNMRHGVPERLKIDYASIKAINPDIIYSQSRGFDHTRAEMKLLGTDQAGSALSGQEWDDGGCSNGGRPFFGTSMGDLGNGYLTAIAVLRALYHKARGGEAQQVGTSIVSACLLTCSNAVLRADGSDAGRPLLDATQLGLSALYGVYETRDGWLCLAVVNDRHWYGLMAALDDRALADARFAEAQVRAAHDAELRNALTPIFAARSAREWLDVLQRHGVPAEQSVPPSKDGRQTVGIDFSDMTTRFGAPAPKLGEHTREILASLDYSSDEIAGLIADGIAVEAVQEKALAPAA